MLFFLNSILVTNNYSLRVSQPQREYNLKASFLYRFPLYIEWNSKFGDAVNIALLRESDIYQPLVDISRDRRANQVINVLILIVLMKLGTAR